LSIVNERDRFAARFLHPSRVLPPLPGVDEMLMARLLGQSDADYRGLAASLENERKAIVDDLISDEETRTAVLQLPFREGQTIVGLGDSITADFFSWFELLRLLVGEIRGSEDIHFVNAGISGETTSQMIARIPQIQFAKPDWVLCLAGGNDARRFGLPTAETQLSVHETIANLSRIRSQVVAATGTQWQFLTPIGIDEGRAAASLLWQSMGTFWQDVDIEQIARTLASKETNVASLYGKLGVPPEASLLEDDGLHPTPIGHARLVVAVMKALIKA
jgi:acyl-CoA thioesterase-1